MKTLAEVLRQSGWTQEQIDALDAKATSGLNAALSAAEQAEKDAQTKLAEATTAAAKAEADRKAAETAAAAAKAAQDAAELQKRSVDQFWNETYNPGVAAWEAEKARLAKIAADAAAEAAFYKAQRGSYLDVLGIKPEDAPEFKAPVQDPAKPVTPGTPVLTDPNAIASKVIDGAQTLTDIQWRHQMLYGTPLPIAPSELVRNADALKLSPMEYASRTFKFAEKEEERRQAAAKAHDDEIAARVAAEKEAAHKAELETKQKQWDDEKRKLAEQFSPNPNVNTPPGSAKFADLKRAQQAGERPDPTRMTQDERRKLTLDNVHKAIEERQLQPQ